jgi:hypothetical protein
VPGLLLALRGEATAAARARYVEVLVSFVAHGIRGPQAAL